MLIIITLCLNNCPYLNVVEFRKLLRLQKLIERVIQHASMLMAYLDLAVEDQDLIEGILCVPYYY